MKRATSSVVRRRLLVSSITSVAHALTICQATHTVLGTIRAILISQTAHVAYIATGSRLIGAIRRWLLLNPPINCARCNDEGWLFYALAGNQFGQQFMAELVYGENTDVPSKLLTLQACDCLAGSKVVTLTANNNTST
jgi:hypothetical protein